MGFVPSKGDDEERERFWNYLDRVVDRVGNRYRLCVLGDLNGWINKIKNRGKERNSWTRLKNE